MFSRLAILSAVAIPPLTVLASIPNENIIIRYGIPAVLTVVMGWLGFILRRLFTTHLNNVEQQTKALERLARASLVIAEELRRRPCMAGSEKIQDLADKSVKGENGQ